MDLYDFSQVKVSCDDGHLWSAASNVTLTSVANIYGMPFLKSQTYLKGSLAVVILYFLIGPPEQENPCTAFLNDTKSVFFFLEDGRPPWFFFLCPLRGTVCTHVHDPTVMYGSTVAVISLCALICLSVRGGRATEAEYEILSRPGDSGQVAPAAVEGFRKPGKICVIPHDSHPQQHRNQLSIFACLHLSGKETVIATL